MRKIGIVAQPDMSAALQWAVSIRRQKVHLFDQLATGNLYRRLCFVEYGFAPGCQKNLASNALCASETAMPIVYNSRMPWKTREVLLD